MERGHVAHTSVACTRWAQGGGQLASYLSGLQRTIGTGHAALNVMQVALHWAAVC